MTDTDGILLFTMEGLFSRAVFEALLQHHTRIKAIVLPARSSITQQNLQKNSLNVLDKSSVESTARFHRIPLYYVNGKDPQQYSHVLDKSQPDIILVACFPYRLPAIVYQYAALGAYNVHPSLLPAYRGPMPLFWQFYFGDSASGISIHEIDDGFDTGNIVLQQQVTLTDGISGLQATLLLAEAAASQVASLLTLIATDQLTSAAQDPRASSYYSWPGLEQFTIPTGWSARRAYNFIRGTRHWNQRYRILRDDNTQVLVREALDYTSGSCQAASFKQHEQQCLIQFNDGCLQALV